MLLRGGDGGIIAERCWRQGVATAAPVDRGLSARQILVERAVKKTTRSAIAVRVVFEGGHVTDNEVIDYIATIRNT